MGLGNCLTMVTLSSKLYDVGLPKIIIIAHRANSDRQMGGCRYVEYLSESLTGCSLQP